MLVELGFCLRIFPGPLLWRGGEGRLIATCTVIHCSPHFICTIHINTVLILLVKLASIINIHTDRWTRTGSIHFGFEPAYTITHPGYWIGTWNYWNVVTNWFLRRNRSRDRGQLLRQSDFSEKLEVFLLPWSLQDTPLNYQDWPNLKIGSSLHFQIIQSAVIGIGLSTLREQCNFWQRRDKYPCERGSLVTMFKTCQLSNSQRISPSRFPAEILRILHRGCSGVILLQRTKPNSWKQEMC
jgi:hypothetical protein